MLTKSQILKLLELTKLEVVAEFDGYKVVKDSGSGWSKNPDIAGCQAVLSILLEVESRKQRERSGSE